MAFAAALSEHPDPVDAVAEVVGDVLEQLGPAPDLAVLFVSARHLERMGDLALVVRELLGPRALLGCSAASVIGGDREVEGHPAVSLWASRTGPVTTMRLDTVRTGDGTIVLGLDRDRLAGAAALVLLADPGTFPVDDVVGQLHRDLPGLAVVGGMASAGFGPGANRLLLDGAVHDDGAVAVALGPDQVADVVVSQGCRPLGVPLVVTRAEGNVVHEIAGRPALERLDELFRTMGDDEQALVQQGLLLGRVIDEHRVELGRGDFLVRDVVGTDRITGSISVGDLVEVGSTVQFHVRDAATADEDLRELLAGHRADAALVFTCNGRGVRLFGEPDHDAEVVSAVVDGGATAGMACAGELGPIGPRSFVHGFTASVVLLRGPG